MISSAGLFSNWIIVLVFECWIDSMVPVCVCFVDCARKIRESIPSMDRTKMIFWKFILLFCLEFDDVFVF
jgi:hypothetical protein